MMNAKAVRRAGTLRLPPEGLGSVPRDVRLTANGIAVVACAILLAVAAIVTPILLSILYVRSAGPGYEPSGMPFGAIPLTVALLLPAAAGCAWSVRRQWILLSEGRATQARITGHKKVHSDKHRMYRVSYEFQTINGARQTSRYDVGKTPPPIGSIMPIVYHREKPEWSAPYPLTLVRPDLPAD